MASFKFNLGKLLVGILGLATIGAQAVDSAAIPNSDKKQIVVDAVVTALGAAAQFANIKELKTPGMVEAIGGLVDFVVHLLHNPIQPTT